MLLLLPMLKLLTILQWQPLQTLLIFRFRRQLQVFMAEIREHQRQSISVLELLVLEDESLLRIPMVRDAPQ